MDDKLKIYAFYLPQFHAIPENDEWWGKGFTEWTKSSNARPLFRGHYQPNIPGELGYYNLLDEAARESQATLAKSYGVDGFIYWHYWFGNGRQLLEKPIQEIIRKKKPSFPFCLAWANQTWTGIWHGLKNRTLIRQEYPGDYDHINHFQELLPAFHDERYIRISGKPVFFIYEPDTFPRLKQFTLLWNSLAVKNGLGGMYWIGINHLKWNYKNDGFDEMTVYMPGHYVDVYQMNFLRSIKNSFKRHLLQYRPLTIPYREIIENYRTQKLESNDFIPTVIPNWDNTPRMGKKGLVFHGSTPELFEHHLSAMMNFVYNNSRKNPMLFIKSWNEWAEGNYLEPDQCWGRGYLEALVKAKVKFEEIAKTEH